VPIGKRRFRHIQIQSDELFLAFQHLAGHAKEEVKICPLGSSSLLLKISHVRLLKTYVQRSASSATVTR
jgi:hypothetical protein